MTKKEIDEVVDSIQNNFRTFGGNRDVSNSNNPIVHALKDSPAQFAAGVDVKDVVTHILKFINCNQP